MRRWPLPLCLSSPEVLPDWRSSSRKVLFPLWMKEASLKKKKTGSTLS